MSLTPNQIDARLMIPDLLRAAPQVRPVLDRYGLRGCGGPWGPQESLDFFARAHDVPVQQLLRELQDSLVLDVPANPEPAGQDPAAGIYRPFFKMGIVVVLTLGASWGAYLLWKISQDGTFAAAGIHEVNAHGHAQIFGWVGLFMMGFAYQAFPRFKHVSLAHPALARASLWLMVAGLVLRSVLQPLAAVHAGWVVPAVAASGLEVLAAGIFVWIILATWRAAAKPLAGYDYYVLAALVWFVVQAVYESAYLAATLTASPAELLSLVATWQAPLRDLQIHGFALLMILGVSQRFFPGMYGLPAPNPRRSTVALVCLNVAVLGEVLGLILMRTHDHAWAALWYASVLLLAGTTAWLVHSWHLFSPTSDADRSQKFLRAAYVWLFVSLGMLVLLPAYQFGLLTWFAPESRAAEIGFSHAFYGATRHAITVGFVSLMIVGVSAKVVPTLRGIDVRSLSPLWAPFLLINAGCTLRVVGQTLTDFTPVAFPVTGCSGLLEVTGLALWGLHLWRVMGQRPDGTPEPAVDGPIEKTHRVGAVLTRHPDLLKTFLDFGFQPLANPLLRNTLARHVTLDQACRLTGVNTDQLLRALNAGRTSAAAGRAISLPLVSVGDSATPKPQCLTNPPQEEKDQCTRPTFSLPNTLSSNRS
jgi:hypothetical protein